MRTAGTADYGRVFRMHERNPSLAIEFLIHDRMGELGSTLSDYGALTVAAYFDEVFWPVRADNRTDIGVAAYRGELGYCAVIKAIVDCGAATR